VKLRGVNVFPEAIGGVVASERRSNGEYVCIVERVGIEQREEMTVLVEVVQSNVDRAQLQADLERRLKEVLGVRLIVEVVERGKTDEYTGTSRTSKIKRLIDRRGSALGQARG
jgi:phenylacetate-CoA ligase